MNTAAAAGPPDIPLRDPLRASRQQRNSRPPGLHLRDRVGTGPASPEVISSLINSLSSISASTTNHFEGSDPRTSLPISPAAPQPSLNSTNGQATKKVQGSFGVDYGAFAVKELGDKTFEDFAAPSPAIKTSKSPSGFLPLSSPKRAANEETMKQFLARPSSKRSSDVQDLGAIGDLSIEPGKKTSNDLKKRASAESWDKKLARNSKSLRHMGSKKEPLREKDTTQQASAGTLSLNVQPTDRLTLPKFDTDPFMSPASLMEENRTVESAAKPLLNSNSGRVSPHVVPKSPSTINGRFIPSRDSSLRNRNLSSSKKRSSRRSSRHGIDEAGGGNSIPELDEQNDTKRDSNNGKRREPGTTYSDALMTAQELVDDVEVSNNSRSGAVANKQGGEFAHVDEGMFEESDDQGAPAPAVLQRRASRSEKRSSSKNSTRIALDLGESAYSKRTSSRLKRLSIPGSPPRREEQQQNRNSAQTSAKASSTSPEPVKPMNQADERPSSADSIDDAVDAYLQSPRLSQKIKHPQTGRVISFSEVGDSEGFAVFCCVGMGLTRYITAFYDELALTLKLRLITPDRPGVGASEPYADGTATPLSWPDDVYAICQALKITKFSILAHSAGAIYALATALRMPQHIRGRIHLLAPWIPPSQMSTFGAQNASPPANSMPTSQRILRALPTPILKAANSSFMSATSSSITSSLPRTQKRLKRKSVLPKETPLRDSIALGVGKENKPRDSLLCSNVNALLQISRNQGQDQDCIEEELDPNSEAAIQAGEAQSRLAKERQEHYDNHLTHAIWDLATTNANPAVDLLVCLERSHTIGFRYVDIQRAVVIHHGSKDTRVPVENVKWLGKTMRRCEVRVLEGEGHGLMASASVMGGVLMEIAKEWEDWMRVVNKKDMERGQAGGGSVKGRERSGTIGTGLGAARDWGL